MEPMGSPKYVIKTTIPKKVKSPWSERKTNNRVKIPEHAIYANRKTHDLHLSFTPVIHSVCFESKIKPVDADHEIQRIQDYAVKFIQKRMRKFFEKYTMDSVYSSSSAIKSVKFSLTQQENTPNQTVSFL